MIFLSLDLVVIIGILKKICTHSIMDSTAVSGAAGSGSIPDGCILPSIICVYSKLNQRLLLGHKNASVF